LIEVSAECELVLLKDDLPILLPALIESIQRDREVNDLAATMRKSQPWGFQKSFSAKEDIELVPDHFELDE